MICIHSSFRKQPQRGQVLWAPVQLSCIRSEAALLVGSIRSQHRPILCLLSKTPAFQLRQGMTPLPISPGATPSLLMTSFSPTATPAKSLCLALKQVRKLRLRVVSLQLLSYRVQFCIQIHPTPDPEPLTSVQSLWVSPSAWEFQTVSNSNMSEKVKITIIS